MRQARSVEYYLGTSFVAAVTPLNLNIRRLHDSHLYGSAIVPISRSTPFRLVDLRRQFDPHEQLR